MANVSSVGGAIVLALAALLAAALTAALIVALAPWLKTYALARPNARSSHREPTPQGGGAAVIAATFAAAWGGVALLGITSQGELSGLIALTAAAALLAVIGAIDDIRGVAPPPRLVLQSVAVGMVVATLPADLQIVPVLPWWLERTGLLFGGVWFVNLVNFMDGIDWMTVAEMVPISGAIVGLGLAGQVSALTMLVAIALLGAMLGFAPFNKPVAKLFLGDVGSLPIGLLLAWLLLQLAAAGHIAAAVLLPLYYLADATITLLRRLAAGERVWQAHRSHYYQRALDRGLTVAEVVARVFAINLILIALALGSIATANYSLSLAWLAAGAAVVGWLLAALARGKS
jgi:UDP-N-acetylmuramyl pentapeptide phosphotransferase/UDP-N-acetylglucosamine-1-phosphate transferase